MPFPLGYDKYTRQTFGNSDFLMNAVNYLCDDSGLISVRARDLKLRLLDSGRISQDKLMLQTLNVALPVILILLFGIVRAWMRRRKNARVA
jgi:ABC-2 type transport system permease protein